MKATPEIREKVLDELTRVILLSKNHNDPDDPVLFSITSFIGGIMKGLEIMEVTNRKDFQCVLQVTRESDIFMKTNNFNLAAQKIRTVLEKRLKEVEND